MEMKELLAKTVEEKASDIIFSVGRPPMMRLHGKMVSICDETLNPALAQKLVFSLLHEDQIETFKREKELDLSYHHPEIGRFRVNVYQQKGFVGAALRVVASTIPTVTELGLPESVKNMALLPRGLVLVTGPTGSGKSTTLAAMIDIINEGKECHIITIEDPIEYVHEHKKSIIDQRELNADTNSFSQALKHAMRQNPDVILVGEMRDLETIAAAITLAETGHLVLSTLHTQSASKAIDRIIDVFPEYQQQQIRTQLALTLQSVICQQLLPRNDTPGRAVALETMLVTPAISNLIREGKLHQIPAMIETGRKFGMKTMDQSLQELLDKKIISPEIAKSRAERPENITIPFAMGPITPMGSNELRS